MFLETFVSFIKNILADHKMHGLPEDALFSFMNPESRNNIKYMKICDNYILKNILLLFVLGSF